MNEMLSSAQPGNHNAFKSAFFAENFCNHFLEEWPDLHLFK